MDPFIGGIMPKGLASSERLVSIGKHAKNGILLGFLPSPDRALGVNKLVA